MKTGADHSTPEFTTLTDLASSRVGGRAIGASDDFFRDDAVRQRLTQRIGRLLSQLSLAA